MSTDAKRLDGIRVGRRTDTARHPARLKPWKYQIGLAPGVPHFANLPFAALQRVAFAGAVGGHLMNLPVLGSLQGAAITGTATVSRPKLSAVATILRIENPPDCS